MRAERLGPCTLEGRFVRLEPLRKTHAHELLRAGRKLDWAWMLVPLRTQRAVDSKIAEGLRAEKRDAEYAFAVVLKPDGRVIGSTSYLAVSSKHRRAEVGATWYSPEFWGTSVNPECKFLLLTRAFEDWGAVRVQLVTDSHNVHSQRAIQKLGAKFEGNLRNYGIRPDGSARDTFVYSVIASEWPEVRARLLERIKTPPAKSGGISE